MEKGWIEHNYVLDEEEVMKGLGLEGGYIKEIKMFPDNRVKIVTK